METVYKIIEPPVVEREGANPELPVFKSSVVEPERANPEPPAEKEAADTETSCLQMFRFASRVDYLLMFIGSIAAIGNGVCSPIFAIFMGGITNGIASLHPEDTVRPTFYNLIILAFCSLVAAWIMMACWMIAGERQGIRCRKLYLEAMIKQ